VDDDLLRDQLAYYRARAGEYDEWFLRKGNHDQGPERNRRWFSELNLVRDELERFAPVGDVLELACGTGLWTVELARHASAITAVDASPEVLDINRSRLEEARSEVPVRYLQTDLFDWRPDGAYDVVFFGFWLSHVPAERFASFWSLVAACLKPEGRVFFTGDAYRTPGGAGGRPVVLDHPPAGPGRDRLPAGEGQTVGSPDRWEARSKTKLATQAPIGTVTRMGCSGCP